ncbi:MAG: vitamin B12-dependent ribonucleotide reductase [Firmicutes bacterium]|nr:vitamin B12-dependent ribonucleotide reductase [Bacillota bacterium]NLL87794.1 vitamin B12-dependent ribonucleotide reductase [Bacillota bacterium]HKM16706.1 vitamin B12-dependent ribonucleotide reductase [Limnochordia bacterium]
MKLSKNARTVLERRYLKRQDGKVVETPEDMLRRVAANIAQVEAQWDPANVSTMEEQFFAIMDSCEFMPNSPTLMNAGRELQQLSACFVLPIEDSMESIFGSLRDAALIQKSGGGTGFSFSRIRPQNDRVKTTGGVASGPISFLKCYNAATEAVKQGGTRRGANMGILRVDHPDILDFIKCKADNREITNFNISVGITEAFMEAVETEQDYPLINPRNSEEVGRLNAREVFNLIVEMAWKNGEPGIVFLDRINRSNPTPHIGGIEATNPCGEQPLLPYESCNLGSINVAKFAKKTEAGWTVDWDRLGNAVHLAVRFLDNVIDANRYPLHEIEVMTKANRKIGLGVMGFADLLIRLGIPYDSEQGVEFARELMRFIQNAAREQSAKLAKERGPFPNYKDSIYDQQGIVLRNATVTTIAPTGTISIIAGCSSGIEPLFALAFTRNVLDNDKLVEVNPVFEEIMKEHDLYTPELMELVARTGSVANLEQIPPEIRRILVTAHDIAPKWHVAMQGAFQEFTDNAVSKTVNFPNEATPEQIEEVYRLAYKLGCKGVTVYRSGSREAEVLTVGSQLGESEGQQPSQRGMRPRKRPTVTRGQTERMKTGCGTLYVTVNEDDEGVCEVFTTIGKAGGCSAAFSEATARMISLALRSGVELEQVVRQVKGIRCPHPVWQNGKLILSCPDAIALVLQRYLDEKKGIKTEQVAIDPGDLRADACPECGGQLKHESGCETCIDCGFSRCG